MAPEVPSHKGISILERGKLPPGIFLAWFTQNIIERFAKSGSVLISLYDLPPAVSLCVIRNVLLPHEIRQSYDKGGLPARKRHQNRQWSSFCQGNKDFMFFQLPNSLPSHPPEIKQEPQTPQQKQSQPSNVSNATAEDEEEKKAQPQYCTLNTLPEGQIGKLKIYKSGKTELWLGEHKLIVNKGTQVGFLQHLLWSNLYQIYCLKPIGQDGRIHAIPLEY
ncbi:uncharacterized protein LOC119572581 [Penaeus monodon]|uniref:uncharacterized protein LOC119572581 n=1 Tax=Penaeus monodon TaxID=6687 RepID=UPI0018A75D32|nr:uncharacterized protein LOC119572581 [Penaeus monodon]